MIEDGVVLRHGPETSSCSPPPSRTSPTSRGSTGRLDVAIEDVTDDWAVLSVQGPRSRDAARRPLTPDVGDARRTSALTPTKIAGAGDVSRTGYTGDLGYEIWVPADGRAEGLGRGLGRRAAARA